MEAIEGKVVNRGDEDDGILDLDEWLREVADEDSEDGDPTPAPYTFIVGGRMYTMNPADDFDWQETARLISSNDTQLFVQLLLGDEEYEEFCKNKLPNKAIKKITDEWQAHYGLTVPESRASRRSSERTARRSKPTSKRRTK
ncbi:hypothetical protein [Streptodolium elevatio]|uniref:Tail assembly chaperone n=1 Tax=Streptodolium elevatio TaxID=3157996 RepID=A0ABV3DLD4_9ACTN